MIFSKSVATWRFAIFGGYLGIRVEVFGEDLIAESCKRQVERMIDGEGYLKRADGCLKGLIMQILGEYAVGLEGRKLSIGWLAASVPGSYCSILVIRGRPSLSRMANGKAWRVTRIAAGMLGGLCVSKCAYQLEAVVWCQPKISPNAFQSL